MEDNSHNEDLKLKPFAYEVFPFREQLKRNHLCNVSDEENNAELILRADETIIYPYKIALKKKSKGTVYIWLAAVSSVAAVLFLFIYLFPVSSPTVSIESVQMRVDAKQDVLENSTDTTKAKVLPAEEKAVKQTDKQMIAKTVDKNYAKPVIENEEEEKTIPAPIEREAVMLASLGSPKQSLPVVRPERPVLYPIVEPTIPLVEKSNNRNVFRKLLAVAGIQKKQDESDDGVKVGVLDRVVEFNITLANSILCEKTVVVEDYDSDGKMVRYAVNSKRFNYEKECDNE